MSDGKRKLTDVYVKNLKPRDKPYKQFDRDGLYLHVAPTGAKRWRLKYRWNGKEQLLTLGSYPEMGLAAARTKLDAMRQQYREGKAPAVVKARLALGLASAEGRNFEEVAREWHGLQKSRWKPVHAADVITSLERDIFPLLGTCPVEQIDKPLLLSVLRKVEARGAVETAHRLRQRIESVFEYAEGIGIATANPALGMRKSLMPVKRGRRWPAFTKIPDLRSLVATIDTAGALPVTRLASRFLALVAQRPGMVRLAEWTEFKGIDWADPHSDISDARWVIPAEKMKQELHLREDEDFRHVVPLAPQAVDVLRRVRFLTLGARYVFCSARSGLKPMSENAIGYLYNREGYKDRHVPHGWRSSFSTVMNQRIERTQPGSDRFNTDRLVIDLMLAHSAIGISGDERTYNRAAYMERRRELANDWADLLMEGAPSLDVILESPRRRAS